MAGGIGAEVLGNYGLLKRILGHLTKWEAGGVMLCWSTPHSGCRSLLLRLKRVVNAAAAGCQQACLGIDGAAHRWQRVPPTPGDGMLP